ncbi:MAG: LysR family transcriptional regulator [Acidobacteria bacterium]|nr:LysR family transcriptional regulator [Acidobacteriota bacterium]MBK9528959.1 LysR family transcriptional regulator [Acidobacteriota bacterium]MBP7474478.1 LysR family transcriptional regulator [Pyrinomonadaceae bacterium]MBP9108852.1 LysR family transcriptional regulator [Pyrinomonadaceae bacterium]
MHIETLKVFCDLVDLESFSLAAERNFITQSAVSQQIRTLEEKFKRRLLERIRGRRDVKLTPAGEVFYRESKQVLDAYEHLNESLRGVVGKIGGTVKVATVYSVGLHELPAKVREFMTKFPAAKIDLEYSRTTRVVRDVLNGTVELGVLAFPEPRRGLTITPMPDNLLVLIAPPGHKFASRKKVKVTELDGEEFVHFERDVPTRKAMDKIFKANNVEVKKVAEFDNIETIKRAVEVGFGLAIVPEPAVIEARNAGTVSVIELAEKYWIRSVGVIYRSDRALSLAAKKFVELLSQGNP